MKCKWIFTIYFMFTVESVVLADLVSDDLNEIRENFKNAAKGIKPSDISKHPWLKEWEDRCTESEGASTFRKIKRASSKLVSCFTKEIPVKTFMKEVNASIDNGELDTVFKKYCGKKDNLMGCLDDMIEVVQLCTTDKENEALNTTRQFLEAGFDFTCFEDGERMAIFLAEDGIGCVTEHLDEMKSCIQTEVPKLKEFDPKNIFETLSLEDLGFVSEEQCNDIIKIQKCAVVAAEKCSDPTPANLLESLLIQMRKQTPCAYTKKEAIVAVKGDTPSVKAHAPPSFYISQILPFTLTFLTAALTAANLLV